MLTTVITLKVIIIRFSDRERTKVELEEIRGKAETTSDSRQMIKLQKDWYVEKSLTDIKLALSNFLRDST
jgi:hypothetical protein